MNLRLLLEKATSGKWEWDHGDVGTDHSEPYCTIYKDGGDLIIAEVNDKFSTEEGHANAALIVALHNCADELLKVAEAAEKYIANGRHAEWCYQQGIHCACGKEKVSAALRALREKAGKL